jgi:DNA-binding beta-propeller fold protein YncE
VVDWTTGVVADAEPAKLKVTRTKPLDFGSSDEQTFAQATATRLYVAGESTIVVVDAGDLSEIARWPVDHEITGLTLGDDGNRLYVAMVGRVDVIDTETGDVLRSIDTPGVVGISHAEPPA